MGYLSSCDDYVQRDQAAIMSVCDPEGLAAAKHVDEAGNPTLNAQLACKQVDMEAQDGVKVISEAKGTWTHAAYHLTSSTAGPPLLSLPFAMAALGWGVGIVALALGAAVSYYACYSLSLAMEHLHHKGKRSLRYCDLSEHVLGAKWTYYLVAPLQLSVCFMVVIGGILLGGQSMKEIYLVLNEEGIVELYSFIIIFGTFVLLLSQMPTMHSLRHFNFISILLCLGFSLCAFIGSLMAGSSREASVQHYNVHGTEISKVLGIFTAISVMVTAYSNPLVIEIQASMAMPIERKMLKGLGVCYSIAVSTFFPVAISGYWAFGNATNGVIFLNMFEPRKFLLVPRWLYFAGNAFACIQLIVYTVLHLHPTFERLEAMTIDVKHGKFSKRNILTRFATRSVFVILATLLSAMLPFFVEFSAFMGALGFTPICIFFPLLFYNIIMRPSVQSFSFWANYAIMTTALVVMFLGGIGSLHQIMTDARTYKLFANV